MVDSGVHMFFDGACYYRQIDTLAMSLCVSKVLDDGEWDRYVMAGYQLSKKSSMPPKVSMAMFTEGFPSAYQRSRLASHLKTHGVPPLVRVAVLTDSALIRGAMTAFGWIMPKTSMRAFDVNDVGACLDWLSGGGDFDLDKVKAAWAEGRRWVGLDK
jgi:hypothetical protein